MNMEARFQLTNTGHMITVAKNVFYRLARKRAALVRSYAVHGVISERYQFCQASRRKPHPNDFCALYKSPTTSGASQSFFGASKWRSQRALCGMQHHRLTFVQLLPQRGQPKCLAKEKFLAFTGRGSCRTAGQSHVAQRSGAVKAP